MFSTLPAAVPCLDDILTKHDISRAFYSSFYLLAREGQIVNQDFRVRLFYCRNYKAAVNEIIARIADKAPSCNVVNIGGSKT